MALLLLALFALSAGLGVLVSTSVSASRGGAAGPTLARLADTDRRPPGAAFARRLAVDEGDDFGDNIATRGRFPTPLRTDPTPRRVTA